MLRKTFICFFVLLLTCSMVIPAFATSPGGDTSASVRTPAVVIDYIRYLNGSNAGAVCDWPNNYSAGGSSLYGNIDDVFTFDCSYSDKLFSTTFYPDNCNYFSFFCSSYFWMDEQHFVLDSPGDSVIFSTVSISGNFVYMSPVNGEYLLLSKPFSLRSSVYGSEIYLDDLIGDAITNFSWPGPVAYLQDVTVTVNFFQSDTSVVPRFRFLIAGSASFSNTFEGWLFYQQLPYEYNEVEPTSLFDWLLDSVNAFLNFELVPGFTLNRIFYIVLVIGVLLWFITLLI